jgi:hypothetical protein
MDASPGGSRGEVPTPGSPRWGLPRPPVDTHPASHRAVTVGGGFFQWNTFMCGPRCRATPSVHRPSIDVVHNRRRSTCAGGMSNDHGLRLWMRRLGRQRYPDLTYKRSPARLPPRRAGRVAPRVAPHRDSACLNGLHPYWDARPGHARRCLGLHARELIPEHGWV